MPKAGFPAWRVPRFPGAGCSMQLSATLRTACSFARAVTRMLRRARARLTSFYPEWLPVKSVIGRATLLLQLAPNVIPTTTGKARSRSRSPSTPAAYLKKGKRKAVSQRQTQNRRNDASENSEILVEVGPSPKICYFFSSLNVRKYATTSCASLSES